MNVLIKKNNIQWAKVIQDFSVDDQHFRIRPIHQKDIPKVVSLFKEHTPYLKNSSVCFLHDETFFNTEVALDDNWEVDSLNRNYFIGVIEKLSDNKVVMVFSSRKETYDLLIQNMATVIDPVFRGQKLAIKYAGYLDQLYEQSGAEYAYGVTTTKHTIAQKLSLDFGWKCGGILPGLIRRHVNEESYYRDTNVFMYKFFNGSKEKLKPLSACKLTTYSQESISSYLDRVTKDTIEPFEKENPTPISYCSKPFSWPRLTREFTQNDIPFKLRPIDQTDISAVARLYQTNCPYFKGSAAQYLHDENFYQASACHLSAWDQHASNRLFFMCVIERTDTKQIVGAFGSKKIPHDSVIQNLAVVVDHSFQNHSLGRYLTKYLDDVWKKTGVDLVFGLVTTQHPLSQKIFFKTAGCKVSAILPGVVRRSNKDGSFVRDTQIYMFKEFFDSQKHSIDASRWHLDPRSMEQARTLLEQVTVE